MEKKIMNDAYISRFAGVGRLYGVQALEKFYKAHVAVVGVGGVGSWVAEALARSGVGEISLIDADDICVTNSNRQIQALSTTVGQLKVEALAKRLKEINPELKVHAVADFVTDSTVRSLISEDFDALVDAIDSAGNKAKLIWWSKIKKIPVVTTGAAGGQLDPTQVQVVDLCRVRHDPLASKVRNILRRHYGYSSNPKKHYCVPCVYSVEQMRYPTEDGGVCHDKKQRADDAGGGLDCGGGFGASMMVTSSFAMAAAAKVLERLAGKP